MPRIGPIRRKDFLSCLRRMGFCWDLRRRQTPDHAEGHANDSCPEPAWRRHRSRAFSQDSSRCRHRSGGVGEVVDCFSAPHSQPLFRKIRAASAWCWFVHHCSAPAGWFGYAFCAFQHARATANTRSSCVPSAPHSGATTLRPDTGTAGCNVVFRWPKGKKRFKGKKPQVSFSWESVSRSDQPRGWPAQLN